MEKTKDGFRAEIESAKTEKEVFGLFSQIIKKGFSVTEGQYIRKDVYFEFGDRLASRLFNLRIESQSFQEIEKIDDFISFYSDAIMPPKEFQRQHRSCFWDLSKRNQEAVNGKFSYILQRITGVMFLFNYYQNIYNIYDRGKTSMTYSTEFTDLIEKRILEILKEKYPEPNKGTTEEELTQIKEYYEFARHKMYPVRSLYRKIPRDIVSFLSALINTVIKNIINETNDIFYLTGRVRECVKYYWFDELVLAKLNDILEKETDINRLMDVVEKNLRLDQDASFRDKMRESVFTRVAKLTKEQLPTLPKWAQKIIISQKCMLCDMLAS